MPNQKIIDSIREQRAKNVSQRDIQTELLHQGWSVPEIQEALQAADMSASAVPPITFTTPASPMPTPQVPPVPKTSAATLPTTPSTQPLEDMFAHEDGVTSESQPAQFPKKDVPIAPLPPQAQPFVESIQPTSALPPTASMNKENIVIHPSTQVTPLHSTSKKKLMMIIGIVAVVMLVLATGAIGAWYYWNQTPLRVEQRMVQQLAALESVAFSSDIKGTFREKKDLNAFVVSVDDIEAIQMNYLGKVSATADQSTRLAMNMELALDSTGSDDLTVGAEIRSIDDTLYAQLTDAPSVTDLTLSSILNTWMVIDPQDALLPGALSTLSTDEWNITQEEREQLRRAYIQYPFIRLGDKIGTESLHNTEVVRYTLVVDFEQAKSFIQTIDPIITAHSQKAGATEDMLAFIANLQEHTTIEGSVAVGKKDAQLHQVVMQMNISDPEHPLTQLSTTLELWDHNEPINIQPPERAIRLQQLMQQLFTSFASSILAPDEPVEEEVTLPTEEDLDELEAEAAEEQAQDTEGLEDSEAIEDDDETVETEEIDISVDADIDGDGLIDELESVYETDPENADSDGDGYLDGEEVEGGFNPLGPGEL